MHDQPKYAPLDASPFFEDGRSARLPVEGTVARGRLRDDELLFTGTENGEPATMFPFPVDAAIMERGQEMFDAFCSPCHGRTGAGDGVVVQRGFTRPPDLTSAEVREAAVGHLFNVITNGFGAMPDHAAQIKVADRWAIIAYLRALQLAGSATIDDVPVSERGRLDGAPPGAGAR
jgi:mono/diheme cytochrome c family protein